MSCTLLRLHLFAIFFLTCTHSIIVYFVEQAPFNYEKRLSCISCILNYKERIKSASRTAVSGSFFGASFGFHATTNRTEADFTL